MIIGICAPAGSGKNTVAKVLEERFGFVSVALADEIKRTAQRWYGFTDEQLFGPSECRNAPDFRFPRGAQAYRDAYEREKAAGNMEHANDYAREGWLTPRCALQVLGTEVGRMIYANTWIDITLDVAKQLLDPDLGYVYKPSLGLVHGPFHTGITERKTRAQHVAIPDVRFKNEIRAIRAAGGKIIRVSRPGAGLRGKPGLHQSETEQLEIEDSEFDWVFDNSQSLEVLVEATKEMYQHFADGG